MDELTQRVMGLSEQEARAALLLLASNRPAEVTEILDRVVAARGQ
jgi:hypothetical protein